MRRFIIYRTFFYIIIVTGSLLFGGNCKAQSQGAAINTTGASADPSAILDVSSTTSPFQGLLIPRLTTANRNLIVAPAEGLLIFNITTKCFETYANGVWQNIFCAACPVPSAVTAVASPTTLCEGSTLTLTGSATNATTWSWIGPNNYTSNLQSPTIPNITTAGTGVYTLTAGNSCGPATAFSTASVTVNSTPSAPTAGTNVPSQTQIVWNWNVVSGANYKWNTTNNYSTATDVGTNTTYTQTGLTCNTPYTLYVWAYNSCGNSTPTTMTQTTSSCVFVCGTTLTVNHTMGAVAPETKTVNYGTVTSTLSGASKCWITQNLGASVQAASAEDATDAAAGWYWQFNRKQGYKNAGTGVTPSWTITSISENSDWLPANDPCTIELGAGWRIPTYTEWSNVFSAMGGGSTTVYTYYSSVLKMHLSGALNYPDGSVVVRGGSSGNGHYWTATQSNGSNGNRLYIYPWNSGINVPENKAYGFTIRCIKD